MWSERASARAHQLERNIRENRRIVWLAAAVDRTESVLESCTPIRRIRRCHKHQYGGSYAATSVFTFGQQIAKQHTTTGRMRSGAGRGADAPPLRAACSVYPPYTTYRHEFHAHNIVVHFLPHMLSSRRPNNLFSGYTHTRTERAGTHTHTHERAWGAHTPALEDACNEEMEDIIKQQQHGRCA